MADKLTRQDIVNYIAESDNNITKAAANRAVNNAIEIIEKSLVEGKAVTITGFGTLNPASVAARTGRKPSTGESIEIPAHKTVRFKIGAILKRKVNE
jgi:DNA-binding protein HU-beta